MEHTKKVADARKELGDVGCELLDRLMSFSDDRIFIKYVMQRSQIEDGWQKVIDFMDSNDNLEPSDIVTFTRKLQK